MTTAISAAAVSTMAAAAATEVTSWSVGYNSENTDEYLEGTENKVFRLFPQVYFWMNF